MSAVRIDLRGAYHPVLFNGGASIGALANEVVSFHAPSAAPDENGLTRRWAVRVEALVASRAREEFIVEPTANSLDGSMVVHRYSWGDPSMQPRREVVDVGLLGYPTVVSGRVLVRCRQRATDRRAVAARVETDRDHSRWRPLSLLFVLNGDGAHEGRFHFPSPLTATPVADGADRCYLGTARGDLIAVDIGTFKLLDAIRLDGAVTHIAIGAFGRLVVATTKHLYLLAEPSH